MFLFSILIFIICPILVLPFLIIGLKKDREHKRVYLIIIAILMALFSYCYKPTLTEDLSRHYDEVAYYENKDIDDLSVKLFSNTEQISTVYKFLISKTGNYSLLQFFTSTICFYILIFLLDEHTEMNKQVRGWKLFGIWFFVLLGFHFIVITSGIFYTLALEIFSLGVYFDYAKNKKKWGWFFYVLPIFIHTCAALPFILIIIYKILGSKITVKNMFILVGLIMSIGFLITVVAPNIDLPIVTELSNLYKWYFDNEEEWVSMHTLPVLLTYLSRLLPIFFGWFSYKKKEPLEGFAIFMAVTVIALYPQTSFSIRYIHIAVLCGIPLLFNGVQHKKYGQIYAISLYALAFPHITYQLHQFLYGLGKFEGLERALVMNLFMTLGSG